MGRQRTDAAVIADARKRDAVNAELAKYLRAGRIRSLHSKRAREMIERACLKAVERELLS